MSIFTSTPGFRHFLSTSKVIFCGSAASIEQWLLNKQRHYSKLKKYPSYFEKSLSNRLTVLEPFFQKRLNSSTQEVALGWKVHLTRILDSTPTVLAIENRVKRHIQLSEVWKNNNFLESILAAPSKLDGQALIWDIIQDQNLLEIPIAYYSAIESAFQSLLSFIWIESHCNEYKASLVYNIPYLGRIDCGYAQDRSDNSIDYQGIRSNLQKIGLWDILLQLDVDHVAVISMSVQWEIFCRRLSLWGSIDRLSGRHFDDFREGFVHIRRGTAARELYLETFSHIERVAEWLETSRTRLRHKVHAIPFRPEALMEIDTCVLLPKFEEWLAYVEVFCADDAREPIFSDFPNARVGKVGSRNVLLVQVGKTQERMAAGTSLILERVNPRIVILGGICGAQNKFKIGDVMISQTVVHLSHGVSRAGRFTRRHDNDAQASTWLHEHAEYVAKDSLWCNTITTTEEPADPLGGSLTRAYCEVLFGTSDVLIDDPNTPLAVTMLAAEPEIQAIDMEVSGMVQAIRRRSVHNPIEWIMIRGVSDLPISSNLTLDAEAVGPVMRAHATRTASINSAKFSLALLKSLRTV